MEINSFNEGTSRMAPASMEQKIFGDKLQKLERPCGYYDASVRLAQESGLDPISCFYEDPGEQMLAFSVSRFWIGRIL